MESRANVPVLPPHVNPLPSYWQDVKSPFANLDSTRVHGSTPGSVSISDSNSSNNGPHYAYIIIGSGISGTMIAYFLLHTTHSPSPRILMLEARDLCSGATGRNGGHTKAASYRSYVSHEEELGKDEALKIARMEYSNILATHKLADEIGRQCESKLCKTVDVMYDTQTFRKGKRAIEKMRGHVSEEEKKELGMGWYEWYDGWEEVKDLGLHVARYNENERDNEMKEVKGAITYLAGRIHAYRFTTGVLGKCVGRGLEVLTNSPVTAIHQTSDDSDKVWQVQTKTSTFNTSNVILATNGYTASLLPQLQAAIVPMRGQITAQRPGPHTTLPSPLPYTYSFIYKNGYEYMIPRSLNNKGGGKGAGGQHIIIGGGLARLPENGASEYGTVDDSVLEPTILRYLRNSLVNYFGKETWGEHPTDGAGKHGAQEGENGNGRIVQDWTGIMGATADGRPFVGQVPGEKGLWMSAGFNGHGMVLCLKSAEGLVGMIRGGMPDWFPESFLVTQERLAKCKFRGRTDM